MMLSTKLLLTMALSLLNFQLVQADTFTETTGAAIQRLSVQARAVGVKTAAASAKLNNSIANGEIYVYRVEIRNAPENHGSTLVSEAVATFLREAGLTAECVDRTQLGSLRSSRSGKSQTTRINMMKEGTEGILLRSAIPPAKHPLLRKKICRSHPGCSVRISYDVLNIAELSIISYGIDQDAHGPDRIEAFQLSYGLILPMFSNRCIDGKDRYAKPASSSEAKKFLAGLGLDTRRTKILSLIETRYLRSAGLRRDLWDFGFLDHSLD